MKQGRTSEWARSFRRYAYPLAKFCVSVWLVPLIQFAAFIFTPKHSERGRPKAIIVTSRSDRVSASFVCLIPYLKQHGVTIIKHTMNYPKARFLTKIRYIFKYFRSIQNAEFVFLDDTFLPVSYAVKCRWLPQPTIVQLWHSAGLFKKVGLDVYNEMLLRYLMRINFRNFDLVAVSAEACRDAIAGFMGLGKERVVALGTSYTDRYVPGKHATTSRATRVVYAPTFRGDAFNVTPSPIPQVRRIFQKIGAEFDCFVSPHPHETADLGKLGYPFVLADTLYEIDILVTDYSSIAMDYLLARPDGKLVLFVPDLETYAETNGFYVSLDEITPHITRNEAELVAAIRSEDRQDPAAYRETYLALCDGAATARLLSHLGLGSG